MKSMAYDWLSWEKHILLFFGFHLNIKVTPSNTAGQVGSIRSNCSFTMILASVAVKRAHL
jgi:hypothetical protein